MATPHASLYRLIRDEGLPSDSRVSIALVDSALEHRVALLLDDAIRSEDLPADHDALVRLAMHSLETAAHAKASSDALAAFVEVCQSAGVEVALFKGMSIAQRWYPSPGLRPASDVDVFVCPRDIDRISEVVGRFDGIPETRRMISDLVSGGSVFEHSVVVGSVSVDVHSDPMNLLLPSLHRDTFWDRTEMMPMPGGRGEVRVLDLEVSVVQALINLLRDGFADLLHIYDIGLMLDNNPDWGFVEWLIEVEGWRDLVRFALGYVCDVLGRSSPLPRRTRLGSRTLLAATWPTTLTLKGPESLGRNPYRKYLVNLGIYGRRRPLLRPIMHRVFPPRSKIDQRLAIVGPRGLQPGGSQEQRSSPQGRRVDRPFARTPYPLALYRWRRLQQREFLSHPK